MALKGNFMPKQIYVNLPVKNLDRSVAFFTRLGYQFNPQFSNENAEVLDEQVRKAVAGGATTPTVAQDHGFMYGHGFEDLDGHIWELVYMVPGATPPKPGA